MSAGTRGTVNASRLRRLLAASAVALVAALATVVGLGTPAAAHGQFVRSDPAAGTEVTTPLETIFIYFTEKPTSNAYFAVTSPSGDRIDRLWSHGPTAPIEPEVHEWYRQPDGEWVVRAYRTAYSARVPIAYWPEVGEYKVEFLSVSTDGEPVRGELTFTYSGPVSEVPPDFSPQRSEPDPNLLAVEAAGAPTAPPTGPAIEEIVAEQQASPSLWVLLVPLGLVLAVVVAVVVFWRLRPDQAKELMVSRFGGRYAAPVPRRPLALPSGLAGRLPARLQERLPVRATRERAAPAVTVSAEPVDPVEAGEAPEPGASQPARTAEGPASGADEPEKNGS